MGTQGGGRLFFSISGVVIGRDRQEPQEVPVAIGGRPPRLRDAKRVDRVDIFGRFHAHKLLPLQTLVPVELVPSELAQLSKSIGNAIAFRFIQRYPVFLKDLIIEVELKLFYLFCVRHPLVS